jgi:hypothetical protein
LGKHRSGAQGADQPRLFLCSDGGDNGAVIERFANATVGRDKSIFVAKKVFAPAS